MSRNSFCLVLPRSNLLNKKNCHKYKHTVPLSLRKEVLFLCHFYYVNIFDLLVVYEIKCNVMFCSFLQTFSSLLLSSSSYSYFTFTLTPDPGSGSVWTFSVFRIRITSFADPRHWSFNQRRANFSVI